MDDYDAEEVGRVVIARYPFLAAERLTAPALHLAHLDDPRRLLHHLLIGIEAAMLSGARAELRGRGVLSLALHHGLIVPASAEEMAEDALMDAGRRVAGVELTVDRAEPRLLPWYGGQTPS